MTHEQKIGLFNQLLNDLGHQISVLSAKQEVAETVAAKLADEIRELKLQYSHAAAELRTFESRQTGLYMWENIGCGG